MMITQSPTKGSQENQWQWRWVRTRGLEDVVGKRGGGMQIEGNGFETSKQQIFFLLLLS